jgi:hypothetical protein
LSFGSFIFPPLLPPCLVGHCTKAGFEGEEISIHLLKRPRPSIRNSIFYSLFHDSVRSLDRWLPNEVVRTEVMCVKVMGILQI